MGRKSKIPSDILGCEASIGSGLFLQTLNSLQARSLVPIHRGHRGWVASLTIVVKRKGSHLLVLAEPGFAIRFERLAILKWYFEKKILWGLFSITFYTVF